MIVKPLPFNKQHFQLFSLFVVQTFLNNLALIDFADLMLATKRCCLLRRFYLALLFIWACKSVVFLLHQSYLLFVVINLYINFNLYVYFIYFSLAQCTIHPEWMWSILLNYWIRHFEAIVKQSKNFWYNLDHLISIYILFDENNERHNSTSIGWFETSQWMLFCILMWKSSKIAMNQWLPQKMWKFFFFS